jgi:hypothetical protein
MAATIGYLLASNIVITPLLSILDFGYLIKLYKQSKVEEQLKIARNTVSLSQKELNKLFEQPEVNFSGMYSNIINMFFISCFFFYILPLGPLLVFIFYVIQYLVNKYLIAKRCKKFASMNSELSIHLAEFSEAGMVLLTIGTVLFKYKLHKTMLIGDIIALVFALLVYFLPIATCLQFGKKVNETITKEEIQGQRRDSLGIAVESYEYNNFGYGGYGGSGGYGGGGYGDGGFAPSQVSAPKMHEYSFDQVAPYLDIE